MDVKGETQLQRGGKRKEKLGRATFYIRQGFLCLKSTGIRMSLLCTFLSNSRPTLTPSCNHCNARIERDERRGIARRQVLESIKPSTFLGEENFCAGGDRGRNCFAKEEKSRQKPYSSPIRDFYALFCWGFVFVQYPLFASWHVNEDNKYYVPRISFPALLHPPDLFPCPCHPSKNVAQPEENRLQIFCPLGIPPPFFSWVVSKNFLPKKSKKMPLTTTTSLKNPFSSPSVQSASVGSLCSSSVPPSRLLPQPEIPRNPSPR